jgi:hypothetical protein
VVITKAAIDEAAIDRFISPPGIFLNVETPKAFSSEVDTGSRKENASKQKIEPRSVQAERGSGIMPGIRTVA